MNDHDCIDEKEIAHRKNTAEIINYKRYLDFLEHDIKNVIRDRPPVALHYFVPSDLVAKALLHSLTMSKMHPDGYRITHYEERMNVMTAMLLTTSDTTYIAIIKYIKDPRETVILITGRDVTTVIDVMDTICEKVKENLINHLRRERIGRRNELS